MGEKNAQLPNLIIGPTLHKHEDRELQSAGTVSEYDPTTHTS